MAGIRDDVGGMGVDPGPRAARIQLVNADGTPVTKLPGDPRLVADRGLPIMGVNDDNFRHLRLDRLGSIPNNTPLFWESFEGVTINVASRLNLAATTFVAAQSSAGGLVLNSTNLTTASSAISVISTQRFAKMQRTPLHFKARARLAPVANAVMELGFGAPALQTSSPTTGAYFQVTAAGQLQAVVTFNGTDLAAPVAINSMPGGWQTNFYTWDVILDDDEALFFVQDTSSGLIIASARIQLPVLGSRLWDLTRLPVFARLHYPTGPATAAQMVLADWQVVIMDAQMGLTMEDISVFAGYGGEANPLTAAQIANYANSAAPTSATLSNTAAGYTTLGGQFQFAAVAGAETDYALFGFTVPSPYAFVCTGVDIDTFNTGALSATTPTLLQWFLSPDQTAISLATSTNRRIPLGTQSIPVGTAIGGQADRSVSRQVKATTHAGRILVLGLKMPVGTATASQIIRGVATIKGYFR